MKKIDLEIFKKYLKEFIVYLCEEDRVWNIDEVSEVLRCVNDIIEEKYDTED